MRLKYIVLAALAVLAVGAGLFYLLRRGAPSTGLKGEGPVWTRLDEARFVGREACAKCHEKEDAKWALSNHERAMQPMNAKTVLADFAGTSFSYHDVTTTFSTKDEKYLVRTDGPDGRLTDYEIAWAFGYRPLQQYLIRFPRGRVQALNVCWDTRPREMGGRRWFHLYPDENVTHEDVLHWTGPYQNWNFMCADWRFAPGQAIARRTVPRSNHDELEMCARCHARRSVVHEPYTYGGPFLDTHRPALLTDPLYFADGQIRDEVYEYASFLQSRMYAAGVTCSDCHDAHTMKVRVSVDGVCSRCHLPEKYAEKSHHFHTPAGAGASCVACHMAPRTYMVVDPRRDHGFRIPRPDLTLKIGTPNACTTSCHRDKSVKWAADAAARWWPKSAKAPHWGEAIYAGREVLAGAREALVQVVEGRTAPAIARATAASMLGGFAGTDSGRAIDGALGDPDPLVRMGALASVRGGDPRTLLARTYPLLNDPIRTVRIDAARALAVVPADDLSAQQRSAIQSGLAEWRASMRVDEDRPEAHLSLGALEAELGETAAAETEYRTALKLAPGFPATYVNLADLCRQTGRDAEGEKILLEGLRITPKSADLHHALGLLYAREKKTPEALAELTKAADLHPDSARYAYVRGVALYSAGETGKALAVLEAAYRRHTGDPEILLALATFSEKKGNRGAAVGWAKKLVGVSPDDASAGRLLAQLESGR